MWLLRKCENTGGIVRWLKKSLKGTCLTWSHMHEKSRWLNFKMAQNLDHVFSTEMAHFFNHKNRNGSKKWAISVKWHLIEILSHFEIEPSRFFMHMTSRETCLIRWLFEPSHHNPVLKTVQKPGTISTLVYPSDSVEWISIKVVEEVKYLIENSTKFVALRNHCILELKFVLFDNWSVVKCWRVAS